MKKIYFIIAGVILFILIVISILLTVWKTSKNDQANNAFPTGIPGQGTVNNQPSLTNGSPSANGNNQNPTISQYNISSFPLIDTVDYKAAYVESLNKVVVEEKTTKANDQFATWANQNNYGFLLNNPGLLTYTTDKVIPTPNDSVHKLENKVGGFFQLLDILSTIGQGPENNQPQASSTPTPNVNNPSPTR